MRDGKLSGVLFCHNGAHIPCPSEESGMAGLLLMSGSLSGKVELRGGVQTSGNLKLRPHGEVPAHLSRVHFKAFVNQMIRV